ncbi:hypothetical protein C8Q76DRAFT_697152 [Earliella scabrosa]|nr:hypothetical protein C8Q76DRAFT_697152 [Earliella scabrosa]
MFRGRDHPAAPRPAMRSPIVLAPTSKTFYNARVMPWELLQIIFEEYVVHTPPCPALESITCDHPLVPFPTPLRARRRSVLGLVCAHWRKLASENSALWRHVDLCPHQRTLQIAFHFLDEPTYPHSRRASLLSTTSNCSYLDSAVRLLSGHSARWESIALFTNDHEVVDAFMQAIQQTSAPHLRQLQVIVNDEESIRHTPRPFIPLYTSLDQPAGLRTLVLQGCAVDWSAVEAALSGATTGLVLDTIITAIPAPRFLSLLARCSTLKSLRISGIFFGVPPGEDLRDHVSPTTVAGPITLPSVTTLSLSFMDVIHAQFCCRYLRLPALKNLRLDLRWQPLDNYTWLLQSLASSPAEHISFQTIETLSIRTIGMAYLSKVPVYSALFTHLAKVTELSLDFRTLNPDYWRGFFERTLEGAVPQLERLNVAGLSATDLQEYIYARSLIKLRPLQIVFICRPRDPEMLHAAKWLSWLRANTISLTLISDTSYQFI